MNTQTTPWHEFVEWTESNDRFIAIRDRFTLTVWHEPDAHRAAPAAAWHYRVEYENRMACEGFCLDLDVGRRACQRTAVKMATFHGMELASEIMRSVAGALYDPHGVPDPANPGKRKAARRVAVDGHKPARSKA